jgi:bifunctional non-homologous end joining protein LigD
MSERPEVAGVEISKPAKVLFPASDGAPPVTKLDLARHYASVAAVMLPHLRGRPVNMQRFPDGIGGPSFYEKKVPSHFPDFVHTVEVQTADGPQRQVVVDDARSLVLLAQQACITPHTWLCRADALDRPDLLVYDLDPSVPGLPAVRRATRMVGELLDDLGLESVVKTTGSRGYHVVVPIRRDRGFDEVRRFARDVARVLVDREPGLLTLEARKNKRGDRVLVDVQRNGYGQTAVPPYAVRARPGAPVSTPITWDELSRVAPDEHTVRTIGRRLARGGDRWAALPRPQSLAKPAERLRRASGSSGGQRLG